MCELALRTQLEIIWAPIGWLRTPPLLHSVHDGRDSEHPSSSRACRRVRALVGSLEVRVLLKNGWLETENNTQSRGLPVSNPLSARLSTQ